MTIFSISEALRFGWRITKKNFAVIAKIIIVSALVFVVPSLLMQIFKYFPFLSFLISVVSLYLQLRISIALLRIAIRFVDGQPVALDELWFAPSFRLLSRYVVGAVLFSLIVFAGSILLVIPGIIWTVKYQFFGYLIVDKGMTASDALKKSGQMTAGLKWQLFLLGVIMWVVNFLGAMILGIGLVVTIPATMIAHAYVYKKLAEHN